MPGRPPQIAVMGAKGAVEIIYRKEAGDPEKIAARTKEYEARFMSPFVAAERGYIDEVIMPARHPPPRRPGAAAPAPEATHQPVEEARQHPAVVCDPDHSGNIRTSVDRRQRTIRRSP